MKVLSLFDGISCGMVALERAGIPVERYVAYEIEPNAIKVSEKNYPQIEHCGDVTAADFSLYQGFDLLIGGSPCQSLSITRAEIRTNLDGKSKLFFEYVRAFKEMHPRFFLFENVASMNEESKQIISELLGCQPILINSNCFVAQDRPRYYWTNIPVDVSGLKECDLCLQDILETDVDESYFYSYPLTNIDMNKQVCATMQFKINEMHKRIFNPKFKVHTLTACAGGNLQKKVMIDGRARKLTPLEYERLQGLPDNYTDCVAKTHRYNALGNGWTVDVIAHILGFIKKQKENKEMELRVENYQLPEKIGFNYEELKNELTERVSFYETLVYTDDQVKEAKNDRSNLNKLKKALNDERIRREKEYMVPFNDFKVKVNEIISIIDKPVAVIDKQVKAYEDKQKQDKADAITSYFNGTEHPEWLHLSQILDEKWLNASVSMKSVQDAIDARLNQIEIDLTTLHSLPEFGFEATQVYISTLDMNKAISEGHRLSEIQKKKAEYEAEQARLKAEIESRESEFKNDQKVSAPVEEVAATAEAPAKKWVAFQALLSTEDALALKAFFESRHIEFKAVR